MTVVRKQLHVFLFYTVVEVSPLRRGVTTERPLSSSIPLTRGIDTLFRESASFAFHSKLSSRDISPGHARTLVSNSRYRRHTKSDGAAATQFSRCQRAPAKSMLLIAPLPSTDPRNLHRRAARCTSAHFPLLRRGRFFRIYRTLRPSEFLHTRPESFYIIGSFKACGRGKAIIKEARHHRKL